MGPLKFARLQGFQALTSAMLVSLLVEYHHLGSGLACFFINALLGFFVVGLLKVVLFQCFPALESALLVVFLVVGHSLRGGLACLLIGDVLELRRLRLQVTIVNP